MLWFFKSLFWPIIQLASTKLIDRNWFRWSLLSHLITIITWSGFESLQKWARLFSSSSLKNTCWCLQVSLNKFMVWFWGYERRHGFLITTDWEAFDKWFIKDFPPLLIDWLQVDQKPFYSQPVSSYYSLGRSGLSRFYKITYH